MNTNSLSSKERGLIAPLINLSEELQKTDCKTLLDTVEIIALNALESLKAFNEKKLPLFDPSIGDEACQIRALMVLQLANQNIEEEIKAGEHELLGLHKKIAEVRIQWTTLEGELKKNKNEAMQSFIQQKKNLNTEKEGKLAKVEKGSAESKKIWEEFKARMGVISKTEAPLRQELDQKEREVLNAKIKVLSDASLEVNLSKKVRQIFWCYILHKISCRQYEENANQCSYYVGVNLKNLQIQGLAYQAQLLETMVSKAKRMMNKESMEFLVEESKKVVGKRAGIIQLAMQTSFASAKEGFTEYSFYHGCELIIKRAQQLRLPILIKSRAPKDNPDKFSCQQLFLPAEKNNKYVPSTDTQANQPMLVIEGVSQKALSQGLSSMVDEAGGLMKMVRLNLAQHRFCTSQAVADPHILLTVSSDMDKEIQRIMGEKEKALALGYSQANPSNFMIDHMYADVLNTQNQ
jgi:hypothetical protein